MVMLSSDSDRYPPVHTSDHVEKRQTNQHTALLVFSITVVAVLALAGLAFGHDGVMLTTAIASVTGLASGAVVQVTGELLNRSRRR